MGTRGLSAVVTVLLVASWSCSRSIEVRDLYGVWIADYQFGRDKLTLQEDGTYTQEIIVKVEGKSERTEHGGRWQSPTREPALGVAAMPCCRRWIGRLEEGLQDSP